MWQNVGGVAVFLFVSFSSSISKCRNLKVLNIFFKWVNILIVVYKCVTQKCQLEMSDDKPYFHDLQVLNQTGYSCGPLPLSILVPLSIYITCITHGSDCEADSYMQNSSRRNPTVNPTSLPLSKQKRDMAFRVWGGVAKLAKLFFGTNYSCLLPVSLSPVFTSREMRGYLLQALGDPVVAVCIWKDPMCSPCWLCSRSPGEGWPRRAPHGENSLIQETNLTELKGLMLTRCSLLERSCECWVGLYPSQWASPPSTKWP